MIYIYAYMKTKKSFHMLQQNWYNEGNRYIRWILENKYKVFIERRIPGWYGIKTILDTPKNNHYFKIGQNVNGMFNAKAKADDLKELLDL